MINNKYLRIERFNVFSHVGVFYEMDREVGSSYPDGEHFVTSFLFILGPDTPLQQILKRQVSSSSGELRYSLTGSLLHLLR